MNIIDKPWGSYEVLKNFAGYWIKVLTIKPLQAISLQSHTHRKEYWVILSGEGVAEVDNQKVYVETGTPIFVDIEQKHRIRNISETNDLVVAEVAIGALCDEQDIKRYSDNYGRK